MNSAFQCRSCGAGSGEPVLDLGLQPLANNLLRPEDLNQPEPKFPLRLFVCPECWLLQIADVVPPVRLFSEYLYFSSFSDAMVRHARQAAERYIQQFALGPQSLVIEVASNDGYLLQNFGRAGIPCLGIEPAANIAAVAVGKGIPTRVEFFGSACAARLVKEGKPSDLVLGNNVMAHVPDLNDFVAGLARLLKADGRAVIEFPYGVDMLERTEFDTIYHEHVFYFTLTALEPLFRRHGLVLYDVERLDLHGGSLRIFAARTAAQSVQPAVRALLHEEDQKGIRALSYYRQFGQQVAAIKAALVGLLREKHAAGQTLAAYGASAKGSTLLNYCGLGRDLLEFVADRSPYKQGRFTPGMHLPIVPAEALGQRRPDYALLLTWNFADEILAQQKSFRERGGKFIIPIPKVQIV